MTIGLTMVSYTCSTVSNPLSRITLTAHFYSICPMFSSWKELSELRMRKEHLLNSPVHYYKTLESLLGEYLQVQESCAIAKMTDRAMRAI